MVGSFAARLRVAEGYEVAIAAALGAAAEAVAVAGLDAAAEILATLRRDDAGSAGLVIAQAPRDLTRRFRHTSLQPHPPHAAQGPSRLTSWCARPTGWRRPRRSFSATWW